MTDPGGLNLLDTSNGSIQRLLRIAKANGWDHISYDCREALQRKGPKRGKTP